VRDPVHQVSHSAGYEPGCSVAAVPFDSSDPDPDSDVIALFSVKTNRFACLHCQLNDDGRIEMESIAAVEQHFDAHRVAEHRVPDSFYEDLAKWEGIDDDIRTTYAWSGREEDSHLSVSRMTTGRCLGCYGCVLNEKQQVECFSTDHMLEHLDEHRSWGLFVADHVYEGLKRDRLDNDRVIQEYFDEHGLQRPTSPLWEPHSIYPEFTRATTRYEIFGQLAAMLVIAIRRFVEPLTESELSVGWTRSCSDAIVEDLRAVMRKIEATRQDQELDFQLMKDMERTRRRPHDEGVSAHIDQREGALNHVSAFIDMDLIGHGRMHDWLTAAAECGRAIKGEEESGMKWIAVQDWDDLEDF
jgi:hypothetical protein